MYFKAVCHRNVWCFTQFAIIALLYSGKAPSLHRHWQWTADEPNLATGTCNLIRFVKIEYDSAKFHKSVELELYWFWFVCTKYAVNKSLYTLVSGVQNWFLETSSFILGDCPKIQISTLYSSLYMLSWQFSVRINMHHCKNWHSSYLWYVCPVVFAADFTNNSFKCPGDIGIIKIYY